MASKRGDGSSEVPAADGPKVWERGVPLPGPVPAKKGIRSSLSLEKPPESPKTILSPVPKVSAWGKQQDRAVVPANLSNSGPKPGEALNPTNASTQPTAIRSISVAPSKSTPTTGAQPRKPAWGQPVASTKAIAPETKGPAAPSASQNNPRPTNGSPWKPINVTPVMMEQNEQSKKRKPKYSSLSIGDIVPNHHILKKKTSDQPVLTSNAFPALGNVKDRQPAKASQPKEILKYPRSSAKTTLVKPKTKTSKANPLVPAKQPETPVMKLDAHHAAGGFFPETKVEGQFDLLKLYSEGKVQKGRQRVRPKRKKFTSLKKKVLEERLRKWKELHPDKNEQPTASSSKSEFTTVCLWGYCDLEELEDDDEYQEIVVNLKDMAEKIGSAKRVFIPKSLDTLPEQWPAFVEFATNQELEAAIECWNGLVLGGQELKCSSVKNDSNSADDETDWQQWCLSKGLVADDDVEMANATPSSTEIIVESALTEDDLDDEECMEESLSDIRMLASKFGEIQDIRADTEAVPPCVRIIYVGDARSALDELNKVIIGGVHVRARLVSENGGDEGFTVYLHNVLTEDDLEDEDCLEESLSDVRELAQKFGVVRSVLRVGEGERSRVKLQFATDNAAKDAAKGFSGIVIGGQTVVTALLEHSGDAAADVLETLGEPVKPKELEPMYSGDKIIPERFAECKRVPKVVSASSNPRGYAAAASQNPEVKPLLIEMLGELMRLQKRAAEDKNAKARRRLVMGLREVARGIRSHKVKMVVMANNLDEYGAIDEKLQEIIDLAQAEAVPIFYEFSKRTLGKAIGKSIKIAVVGVQNAEGAHQQFKKLTNISAG